MKWGTHILWCVFTYGRAFVFLCTQDGWFSGLCFDLLNSHGLLLIFVSFSVGVDSLETPGFLSRSDMLIDDG